MTHEWISQKRQEAKKIFSNKSYWVFVLNNPESNDLPKTLKDIDTVTWQLEKGSRGIPHLQGVVQFLYPKSWSQVRDMLPRAWWQVMLGSIHQAKEYCTKEHTRVAGPWSYSPISQAVAECLAGLSGGHPLYSGGITPAPHAHIEDTVVPPHAIAPAPEVAAVPNSSAEPVSHD